MINRVIYGMTCGVVVYKGVCDEQEGVSGCSLPEI